MTKIIAKGTRCHPLNNSRAYNAGMAARGRLGLMMESCEHWLAPVKLTTPKGGRPRVYADDLIILSQMLDGLMKLGARGVAGVLQEMSEVYCPGLPVPHHATICRRAKALGKAVAMRPRGRFLPILAAGDEATDEVYLYLAPVEPSDQPVTDIALDGTGLSARGPGLYRLQNGKSGGLLQQVSTYARVVALTDLPTGRVLGIAVAKSDRWSEDELARVLLDEFLKVTPAGQIKRFSGDGLYDKATLHILLLKHSPLCIIKTPPAINATEWTKGKDWAVQHNEARSLMHAKANTKADLPEARKWLKRNCGYMQRNLIETWMSRLVKLSGGRLKGVTPSTWFGQLVGYVHLLNHHVSLGWPDRDRLWHAV